MKGPPTTSDDVAGRHRDLTRQVPKYLLAMGHQALPAELEVRGEPHRLSRVFKHDFFAVTALYEAHTSKVLLKVGRMASFFGVPLAWTGRWLTKRERAALIRLEKVEGVPRYIEPWGPCGIIREFVDGEPLAKGRAVGDSFHPRLRSLIDQIHAHGMAYVDLEKCENVLEGADGNPHLFDFQIAWLLPKRWGGELYPARILRGWFQNSDRYHLAKLQRRTRPDQMTPEELTASYKRPWYVRTHKWIVLPFTKVRRAILQVVDPRRKSGERGRMES